MIAKHFYHKERCMDVMALVAAFGGGVFAAAIGALPAFIFTGFLVLAGNMFANPGNILGNVAFGSLFGPHVAFAGGVAAAAYAATKRHIGAGTDILTSLNKFNDVSVLVVGGVFGVIGFLINFGYATALPFLKTDTVALTVFTSGVIVRLVFGKSGLMGKTPSGERRIYYPMGEQLIYNIVLGFAVALVFAYVVKATGMATLGFGISAISLIFAQTGFAVPATHHITLIAGIATLATGNIFIGAAMGLVSNLIFELGARLFNSYCDTHIDPPAFAIFICTTIVNLVLA
jgi:hypothetical protein